MAISFEEQIKPLFTDRDLDCMGGQGVPLDDYGYMSDPAGDAHFPDHRNARAVLDCLLPEAGPRRMPKHGPYWDDERIRLYKEWMSGGFQP